MSEKKMWGGRFGTATGQSVEKYTCSVDFDKRLYRQDIQGSKAHARMLASCGVITREEARQLVDGLRKVESEIEDGLFEWNEKLEDVHMNIESRLTEIVGPVGRKLHTGRSRNDQVALDFRLYVADSLGKRRELLAGLAQAFLTRAKEHQDTLMPGYTHMQPAQPVSLAHHLLAYAQMFRRDFERSLDCEKRVRVSPLGAAALAGTTYPLDPEFVARELGFEAIFKNSLDAVSDRDFALEAIFGASLCMLHLSRFCEEIIIWSNPSFGFISLPDAFATGSSIMPQKKNPDVAELMRGKTGRVYGSLFSLLTTLKSLPLAYNRDMQEDKVPFFDAEDTLQDSLAIMTEMLLALKFRPENMRRALVLGYLNATELADYLAAKGVPFREAHHVAGSAVALAERQGKALEDLSLEELKSLSGLIESDVFLVLQPDTAVARRTTPGGTSGQSVQTQMRELDAWLESLTA